MKRRYQVEQEVHGKWIAVRQYKNESLAREALSAFERITVGTATPSWRIWDRKTQTVIT